MLPLCQQCKDATIDALEALGGTATRTEIREWAFTHGDIDAAAPPDHIAHHLSWALAWLDKQGLIRAAGHGRWSRSPTPR
jgi:hypothetical protein